MYLWERIKVITDELSKLQYSKRQAIKNFSIKDGHYKTIAEVDSAAAQWQPFQSGSFFGRRDSNHWLRTQLIIPAQYHGQTTGLVITTGENGWDAINPQFMLYLNGKLIQGLDVNHREIILSPDYEAGQSYQLDLHAYAGTIGDHGRLDDCSRLFAELVVIDMEVRQLFYQIHVPWLIIEKLDPDDLRRIEVLEILNNTINLLDLRKPYHSSYYQSIKNANQYITAHLYEKIKGPPAITATTVGHTHIDVAWWWTVAQTRQKVVRSFSTALNLMKEYPEYRFMSSQPQLYQFVKEDQPELFAAIKEKVQSGQWEAEGAMWLEADTNLPCGESLVRQLLFGKLFFRQEFGVESEILWLPDVFGYSAALPQLLKKAGVHYFMTTKISWNQYNKMPMDTFMWRGIDGSEILTHFITTTDPYQDKKSHFTTYNGQLHPGAIMGAWDRYQQKDINQDVLVCYGFGDGGGGPTREMLEMGRRLSRGLPGCPRVKHGPAKDYFERLERKVKNNPDLPTWVGELYLEYHRGTYTSMARNKRSNRKNELLLQAVELFSTLALLHGGNYDQKNINKNWQTLLLNQFHDILPGSSIKEVYTVTRNEYREIADKGRQLLHDSLDSIIVQVNLDQKSIVVFNPLSFTRTDIARIEYDSQLADQIILDRDGQAVDCQIIEEKIINKNEEKVEGKSKTQSRQYLLFLAQDIPALGYKTFKLAAGQIPARPSTQISRHSIENQNYLIKLDENGLFSSIFDKINARELLKTNQKGNILIAYEDKPMNFDNWDIDEYYREKSWPLTELESIRITENGNIRSCLELTRIYQDSKIIQNIYFYEHSRRIDFVTYVDWQEQQTLLKVEFPLDIQSDKATYDIQFGNVERPTHKNTSWDKARFEVCAHKWADLSEAGYGVSLLNDCKYGHDIFNSNLRLTLIKSGIVPNPAADQEEHFFTYALYPHSGTWREAHTIRQAGCLNSPLYSKLAGKQAGCLKDTFSFVTCRADNICIETVKKAEKSDRIIIRLYEAHSKRINIVLDFFREIEQAYTADLLEEKLQPVNFKGKKIFLTIKPYEIITLSVMFKS